MSHARRAAILRRWLAGQHAPMPSRDALARIWEEVALAREDADPLLQLGSHAVRRYRGRLWWVKIIPGQRNVTLDWLD
ncbi:TilS substrate-binding domain-containing protein, partial [Streptococcus gordonii]|nr:TilS substrate-binding domain-containing protein [Streptococcus gordonii]